MGLDLDTNTEKLIALGALQTLNAFNSGRAQQAISDETKAASLEANRLTNSFEKWATFYFYHVNSITLHKKSASKICKSLLSSLSDLDGL